MQVLTSLSGLPLSAASAGFAPTNSADVSAIASAYQVVSSTGTQLHAGTAYLTGVNGAPISASRAGQAANASLANSAYYDGTGRLISALPDSAAVSAIASSYAESAASGKQDTIEFGYDANNLISSIDGSGLAGQGGGGGLITSIESALDPWYQTGISGLNGSALYPKWAESAQSAAVATNASSANTAHYAESAPTAWASAFITGVASPSGTIRVQGGTAIESTNSALLPSTVIEGFSIEAVIAETTNTTSFTVPVSNPTTRVHFGDAYGAPGTFAIDTDNGLHFESSIDSYFDVTFDLPNATSFTATYPWVGVLHYTASATYEEEGGGVAELAWASALPTYEYDGDGKISAIDGSAIAGGGGGGAGVVTSVSSYSGYATAINESSIMTVPSAHAYYTSSALNVKDTTQFNNRYVSPYVDSSTLYTPPGGCNTVLISGIANGNIYYSASATLVDGTTASASYGVGENSGLFTASANISAMRLLTRSISNYYYRTAYFSAGAYRPSGDAIIPLLSNDDLDVAVLKTDAQIALNGAFADPNCLAIGTGAKAYEASIAVGTNYNTANAESIAVGSNNSAVFYGYAVGVSNTASGSAMAHGYANGASGQSLSVGSYNSSQYASVALGAFNTAGTTSVAMGSANTASQASLTQGIQNSAYWNSLAVGSSLMAGARSLAVGASSTADKTAFAQGRACYASGNSFAQGSFNSATDYSFAQGYGLLAENTLAAFGTYNQSSNGAGATGAAFVIGDGTASDSLHDLMVVTKDGEITMFSGTADTVGTGIMSSIRAISAAATGGGGVDSATVSAIASSYVESGVSSKLDSSASSDFYSTGNPSGFIDSAYVESSVSGKQDTFSAGEGLEFVQSGSDRVLQVEAPVDIVAGPGIVIDNPDGNTLRISQQYPTDETVLWEGSATLSSPTISLSETLSNFSRVKICWKTWNASFSSVISEFDVVSGNNFFTCIGGYWNGTNASTFIISLTPNGTQTVLSFSAGKFIYLGTSGTPSNANYSTVYKIVGVHRIANN